MPLPSSANQLTGVAPLGGVSHRFNVFNLCLSHGSEAWTVNTSKLKSIEAAEMNVRRHLTDYTYYDHIRNEDSRNALKILAITEAIQKYRNN